MKTARKIKTSHSFSDSEIKNRQKLHSKRSVPDTFLSDETCKQAKNPLFSSLFSLKTVLNQFLSEEVYEDLISFFLIIISLPLILIKRILAIFSWIYKRMDELFLYSYNKVNQCIDEKKKLRLEKRRFSKNTLLELFFKKKQLEEKAKICKDHKLDLVLDLDETLIHCTAHKPSYKTQEFEIVKNEQKKEKFYFSKRPFLEDFLEEVSLFFNVHVYTASEKDYADIILGYIDPKNKIQKRLYRKDCWKDKDDYTKDLRRINEDLSKVIMIDNSAEAVKNFLENSFIIKSWHGVDKNDSELEYYTKILIELAYSQEDIRMKLKKIKRELKCKYFN